MHLKRRPTAVKYYTSLYRNDTAEEIALLINLVVNVTPTLLSVCKRQIMSDKY